MTDCRFVASGQPRVIAGRHLDPCVCDGEFGCMACPEYHCVVCGRAHARVTCVGCLDAARGDLRTIGELYLDLDAEAQERGVQSQALMLAGPAADPEAWQFVAMSAMRGRLCRCIRRMQLCPSLFGKTCPDQAYLEDNRDELHPLFVVGSWEQVWRGHLDHYTEAPVTVAAAVTYLDMQIGYMSEQEEPAFEEFARDVRACRSHLEDVLRAGDREERTRVPCVDCGARLVKVYGHTEADDRWRCPTRACSRIYDGGEYARLKQLHLHNEHADKFVKVSEALGMIERPEQTLRAWMANGKVKTQRDPKTGALLVWWPDVRDRNRDTKTRRRRSA